MYRERLRGCSVGAVGPRRIEVCADLTIVARPNRIAAVVAAEYAATALGRAVHLPSAVDPDHTVLADLHLSLAQLTTASDGLASLDHIRPGETPLV